MFVTAGLREHGAEAGGVEEADPEAQTRAPGLQSCGSWERKLGAWRRRIRRCRLELLPPGLLLRRRDGEDWRDRWIDGGGLAARGSRGGRWSRAAGGDAGVAGRWRGSGQKAASVTAGDFLGRGRGPRQGLT